MSSTTLPDPTVMNKNDNADTHAVKMFLNERKEGTTVEQFKEGLNKFRFDYTDEIPTFRVNSTTPAPEGTAGYKVRNAWFNNVALLIEDGMVEGYVTPDNFTLADQFLRFVKNIKQATETTKEEIDYANKVLDTLIDDLE